MQSNFNPRSPWGERLYTPIIFSRKRDFNPRSPWGERHQTSGNIANNSYISIHALREESDERIEACTAFCPIFQSTLSVRRATLRGTLACKSWFYFNPRSPWGERQHRLSKLMQSLSISIHALREESDIRLYFLRPYNRAISIHALREESDTGFGVDKAYIAISIHALREESDLSSMSS